MLFLPQSPALEPGPLPAPQLVIALTLAFTMLIIVVELVRRQKLREEYAILWIGTAIVLIALALNSDILGWLGEVTQAESNLSILFFGALVFLMLVALQFSVRLTKLTFRSKTMSQRMALLEQEIDRLNSQIEKTRTPSRRPESSEVESQSHEH